MPVMTAYTVRYWGVQWGTKQDLKLTVKQVTGAEAVPEQRRCSGMNSQ